MPKNRKKYAKALARSGNPSKSIAVEALKDVEARKWITLGIGKIVNYELKLLCSDEANSILRSQSKADIAEFPWKKVIDECTKYCPTLWMILMSCTAKATRSSKLQFLAAIICMLAKFRSSRMSLLQKLVSTILYADHVGTAV